tara:strand:+ start:23 stop:1261 length:1239 start_codon:yes stop_codon:yes gene_type:complete
MSLLRFGQALGQTLRGLPENQLVMGGLGLMSANQPGQATPVDQPGSFLKGMLSANALRQNRLLQEEQAKEKERQEAQRLQREQVMAALMPTLTPQNQMMLGAFGNNPDVIKSIIARQNPQPPKYENVKMDKIGNAYGVNMNTGQFELIPTGQQIGQAMPINAGEVVDTMPAENNVSGSAAGFVAEAPLSESEIRLRELQIQNEENEIKDRETKIAEKQEKIRFGTVDNAQKAIRSADAVYEIQKILDENPEGDFFEAGPTGTSSQLLGWKGGTAARNVKALLGTIYASFGFKTLADMKAASPQGGALGAINKSEMDLLIASVIALDPSMSRSLFEDQLGKVVTHYNSLIAATPPDVLETINTGPLQSSQFVPNSASPTGYTIMPQDVVDTKKRTEDGGIIGATSDGKQKVYF